MSFVALVLRDEVLPELLRDEELLELLRVDVLPVLPDVLRVLTAAGVRFVVVVPDLRTLVVVDVVRAGWAVVLAGCEVVAVRLLLFDVVAELCVRCEVVVVCVVLAGCELCVRCGTGCEAAGAGCVVRAGVGCVVRAGVADCDVRVVVVDCDVRAPPVAGCACCEVEVRAEVLCCVRAGWALASTEVLREDRVLVVVRDAPDCSTACCR